MTRSLAVALRIAGAAAGLGLGALLLHLHNPFVLWFMQVWRGA